MCGLVKNIGREGELYEIMTLKKLKTTQADMFTTVYIGNSNTKELNGKMVTPRGYKDTQPESHAFSRAPKQTRLRCC